MKKICVYLSIFVLVASLSACQQDDDLASVKYSYANTPQALAYCKEHKSELLKDVFKSMAKDEKRTDPVVNNPDLTRQALIPIGYDGLNVQGFLEAGAYLDSLVVDSLVKKAVAKNNKTALLISGSAASGKSTALKKVPALKDLKRSVGFASDQTFESLSTLKNMIELLKDNGFAEKDITIVLVYCDAPTSFFSACSRLYRTGRTISKEYFADFMYPSFAGRIDSLYRNYGKTHPLIFLDNTKLALSAITDVYGETIGYSGADASVTDSWFYYNSLIANTFKSVSSGAKEICSEKDLPSAIPATETNGAHWFYDLSEEDVSKIIEIASIWARGGNEPYAYALENIPWFNWNYDYYI